MLTTATRPATRPAAPYLDLQEWGPAKHDPDHPFHVGRSDRAVSATALRDVAAERPDDN